MPEIHAWTDGACSGNPGPGGWGVLMRAFKDGEIVKERELEALSRPTDITIVTDSAYVKNGVTGWIYGWKRNGWKTAAKKPVKNVDLWQRLDEAQATHNVTWKWIKGHAGHAENEKADELAREGMAPFKKSAS